MARASRYSPEVRERSAWFSSMRPSTAPSGGSIRSIASKIGCSAETLRTWFRQAERDQGRRPGLTTDERKRLNELEREVRELRRANKILRKTSSTSISCGTRSHASGSRGGSLAALQELLGHASIVTTQRYARLSDDLVRREVERLASG